MTSFLSFVTSCYKNVISSLSFKAKMQTSGADRANVEWEYTAVWENHMCNTSHRIQFGVT